MMTVCLSRVFKNPSSLIAFTLPGHTSTKNALLAKQTEPAVTARAVIPQRERIFKTGEAKSLCRKTIN
jgi:hypothetical protein